MSQIETESYEVVLVPDESQESQNLLQRYVSEFGIPGFDLGLPKARRNGPALKEGAEAPTKPGSEIMPGVVGPSCDVELRSSHFPTSPEPRPISINSSPTSLRAETTAKNRDQNQQSQHRVHRDPDHVHNPIKFPPPARAIARIMDISESPTQANDDRDYETECHLPLDTTDPLTSPGNHHETNQSDQPRTLHEDDTGAVNFAPLSQDGKDMSQESDILSPFAENPVLQRGDWRGQRASQRLGNTPARPSMAAPPETPAGPVNPFATRQRPASVLRATQLFNATQFSSGGVKKFSPTSSRPSPHAFHQTFPTDTSPAGLLTSPLKDRTISSPSIFRKSSPPHVQIPSTSFAELPPSRSPPHQSSSRDEEAIPESPPGDPDPSPPRKRQRQELLEDYEPVAVSQQRKLMSDELNKVSDLDSDEDDDLRRRRLARQKRERAERRLNDISFIPPARDTAASNTRKRNTRRGGRLFVNSTNDVDLENERNDLAGRRRPSSASGRPFETPSNVRFASVPPQEHNSIDNRRTMTSPAEAQERIPPTSSPLRARAMDLEGSERSSPPLKPQHLESSNASSSVSLPTQLPPSSSQISKRKYGFRRVAERTSSKALVPESPMVVPESDLAQGGGPVGEGEGEGDQDDDTVLAPSVESSGTTRSRSPVLDDLPSTQPPPSSAVQTETRDSRLEENTTDEPETVQTVPESAHGAPKKPPSPLSNLSSTPSLPRSPRETTSSTSRQDLYDLPTSSAAELPLPKSVRAPLLRKTYSKVRRTLRATRTAIASSRQQHDRYDTGSTDELAKSPSRGTFNSSMLISRTSVGRSGRLSDSSMRGNQLLFDNMAFAISFQARRDDETEDEYRERCSMSEELCDVVSRAGGKILANGFNELLDPATLKHWPVVQSSSGGGQGGASNDDSEFALELGQQAKGLGFTALLADGHSRKVKYMQALALGLPCLAYQWATACLEKGEILDWSPYLLCAGQSVCVGNAILSRHLVPYSAIGAALEDVVGQRKELLGGDRILLVMKKSRAEETKMAYLLLARILGAKLIRAYNIRDARNALRRSEARDQRFDWVYVDEETGLPEQLFSVRAPEEKTTSKKKRKRSGGGSKVATTQDGPAPGRVRCLSNELVIQSLIMGRIIDEDERAFTAL